MIRREAVRSRIASDVRQPQALAFVEDDAEEPVADRRRSDSGTHLGSDTRGDEGLDRAVVVDDRQRAVLCADQRPRAFHDFVEHRIERQLRGDVEPGAVQREQLFVMPLQPMLHPSDRTHHDDAHDRERGGHKSVEQETALQRGHADRHHAHDFQRADHDERRDDGQPAQLFQRQLQFEPGAEGKPERCARRCSWR